LLICPSLTDSKAVFVCRRPTSHFAEYSLELARPLLEMLLRRQGGEFLRNRCAYKLVDRDSFSASQFDLFMQPVAKPVAERAHFESPGSSKDVSHSLRREGLEILL